MFLSRTLGQVLLTCHDLLKEEKALNESVITGTITLGNDVNNFWERPQR